MQAKSLRRSLVSALLQSSSRIWTSLQVLAARDVERSRQPLLVRSQRRPRYPCRIQSCKLTQRCPIRKYWSTRVKALLTLRREWVIRRSTRGCGNETQAFGVLSTTSSARWARTTRKIWMNLSNTVLSLSWSMSMWREILSLPILKTMRYSIRTLGLRKGATYRVKAPKGLRSK